MWGLNGAIVGPCAAQVVVIKKLNKLSSLKHGKGLKLYSCERIFSNLFMIQNCLRE